MSNVTNLLIHIWSDDEAERVNQIQECIEKSTSYPGRPLVAVDDRKLPVGWYGGNKSLECSLYIGAYNYLLLDEFVEQLTAIQWTDREVVQLLVMEQEEMEFKIISIKSWKD